MGPVGGSCLPRNRRPAAAGPARGRLPPRQLVRGTGPTALTGASHRLGTHQGNLSRRLQRIERATVLIVFHRNHRGAMPTAAGRLLLHGADALLLLVDQLPAPHVPPFPPPTSSPSSPHTTDRPHRPWRT
ncbi:MULTISPECIES: LysR family transcriptional regulator [Streptomyces]|uniref:LysR family transcriptional regulator n=1 Tax=Streptomyces TaxID=1883 RepID=UPI003423E2D0